MELNDLYKLAEELGEHEILWWQAHHRGDIGAFKENKTQLYEKLFDIPHEKAVEAIDYFIAAAKEHDYAEIFEDEGNQAEADKHWDSAQKLLIMHYKKILLNRPSPLYYLLGLDRK